MPTDPNVLALVSKLRALDPELRSLDHESLRSILVSLLDSRAPESMANAADPERAYNPREAGAFIGVATITLQQMRARGEGPKYYKIGSGPKARIRYRLGDLIAYRAAQTVGR